MSLAFQQDNIVVIRTVVRSVCDVALTDSQGFCLEHVLHVFKNLSGVDALIFKRRRPDFQASTPSFSSVDALVFKRRRPDFQASTP